MVVRQRRGPGSTSREHAARAVYRADHGHRWARRVDDVGPARCADPPFCRRDNL